MTYGWSILIIAVVIASLIELGVFNSANLSPSSCIATTGYSCTNPTLYASGALITKLGQVGTGPITITGTACTRNNTVTTITSVSSTALQSEQQQSIIFHCPLTTNATGTQFTGHLWIEYTTASQQNIIQEVGSVIAPVVSSNVSAYAPIAYITTNTNVIGINLNTKKIVYNFQIPIPGLYLAGISLSGSTAYLVNTGNEYSTFGNVIAFDLTTNTVTAIYNVEGVMNIAMAGSDAYLTSANIGGNIIKLDLTTGTTNSITSATFPGTTSGGIAISGSTAYVTTSGSDVFPFTTGNVVELNLITGNLIESVPPSGFGTFYYPGGIVISGSTAYVVSPNSDNVLILNINSGQVTGSIDSADFYAIHNIAISGSTAYIVDNNGGVYGTGNIIEVNTTPAFSDTVVLVGPFTTISETS